MAIKKTKTFSRFFYHVFSRYILFMVMTLVGIIVNEQRAHLCIRMCIVYVFDTSPYLYFVGHTIMPLPWRKIMLNVVKRLCRKTLLLFLRFRPIHFQPINLFVLHLMQWPGPSRFQTLQLSPYKTFSLYRIDSDRMCRVDVWTCLYCACMRCLSFWNIEPWWNENGYLFHGAKSFSVWTLLGNRRNIVRGEWSIKNAKQPNEEHGWELRLLPALQKTNEWTKQKKNGKQTKAH